MSLLSTLNKCSALIVTVKHNRKRNGYYSSGISGVAIILFSLLSSGRAMAQPTGPIDLSKYVRVGRYDLPEPTRTAAPANNLLAQEVSAITYNWDSQTLFVVGDGGTAVVQVSKTGQLINTMTLSPGSSPQNTEFYDPEGLTYIGNGQFVMTEERDRQAVLFTYVPGGTLLRSQTKTVKLGTFVQNIGIEGMSYDPLTSGYIGVKETQPLGIFQTGIDFNAGTATNGSATMENAVDLFNPSLAGLLDFADIFALSNLPSLNGTLEYSRLLILSQESGKIVNIDRSGNISSSLTIATDPGNPLTVAAQQHEGLTMDRDGVLYVVSENGGGDFDHPQMWVYAPSNIANQAPTAITLTNTVTSILENTSTAAAIKLADIVVADDGIGTNNLSLSGVDAGSFEITGSSLYLKPGVVLDYELKTNYSVTIDVDDPSIGAAPDASITFNLAVIDIAVENPVASSIIVSEVAPWSSGSSPVGADWFELTNTGSSPVNISGWKVDDNSNSFASSVALNGITTIAPGESVIFLETATPATTIPLFISTWFGANPPAGLQVGNYSGSGIGLSTDGDAVNIYAGSGTLQASITFGISPSGTSLPTFNNAAGLNNGAVTIRSVNKVNGAFAAVNDTKEIGSPGTIGKLFISEVAPWASSNGRLGADWFEVTNTFAKDINITGWKMDDNSGSPAAAVPLSGIATIPAGKSVIFIESGAPDTIVPLFKNIWFGGTAPEDLLIGTYTGGGVGLGTGGDAVNLYNASGVLQASVLFGSSPASAPFTTFDNIAGLNNVTISQMSVLGVNGAFIAPTSAIEIGSPGVNVYGVFAPLPVTLTALKASQKSNGVQLEWSAYGEQGIDKYQIEKSADGINFHSIGNLFATGNGASTTNYSFIDNSPFTGANYYRVKVLDKNAGGKLTNIVKLQLNTSKAEIAVYPNPIQGSRFSLELTNAERGLYNLQVFNNRGQLVFNEQIDHQGGSASQSIHLPQNLKAGIYQVRVGNKTREFIQTLVAK